MACHHVIFVVSLISLITYIETQAGPKCLYCNGGLSQPYDCTDTIQCESDEKCFTDKYITIAGHTFFSVGCRANSFCRPSGKRASLKRQLTPEVHICEECCDGEFCNAKGCNANRPKGTHCYHCDYVNDPLRCEQIKTCQANEQCFIEEVLTDDFRLKYNLGCMGNYLCEQITMAKGKREDDFPAVCSRCCTDDYCNLWCGKEAPTTTLKQTTSTTTSITTTSTTTTPTTTTTSTSTSTSTTTQSATTSTKAPTTTTTQPPPTTTLVKTAPTTTTSTTVAPPPTTTTQPPTTTPTTTTTQPPTTTSTTTTSPSPTTTQPPTTTSTTTTTAPPPTSTTQSPTTTPTTTTTEPSTSTKTPTSISTKPPTTMSTRTTTETTTSSTSTTTTTTTTRAPAVCYECQFERDMDECHHSVQCREHYNTPDKEYTCFSGRVLDNGCYFTASCMVREACTVFRNRTKNGENVVVKGYEYDDVECCDTPNCNHRDLVIPPALAGEHHCDTNP